jgi:hypothetical protein
MKRTFAAAVFALLALTTPAHAATLTLWNLDLKTNPSICGSPFVCSPQETVTGDFVFYSAGEISSWDIHAAVPDTADFYQGFGQTATTTKIGFPADAYLFFNNGADLFFNKALTLDRRSGARRVINRNKQYFNRCFPANRYSSVGTRRCWCNPSVRHSRLRRYNPRQSSASSSPAVVRQRPVSSRGLGMVATGEGFSLAINLIKRLCRL